jgi:hypothetical protein
MGLYPVSKFNDSCKINFLNNQFLLEQTPNENTTGAMVDTSYSSGEESQENSVILKFRNCSFDSMVLNNNLPKIYAIKVAERGSYNFKKSQYLSIESKIFKRHGSEVIINGNQVNLIIL